MKINTDGLTKNEIEVMEAARNSNFGDIIESGQWSFSVCEQTTLGEKVYRGVVSSLIKKGLVEIHDYEENGRYDDMIFELTEAGKQRYSDYKEDV